MTATVTDLFCGAGGSSTGAAMAGMEIVLAANHWSTAIDVHQVNHPDAAHDVADISQVDPRRYPRTDVLLASPECTNHSQARGISRKRQDPTLWDAPNPAAERSRATMWDVLRFAEQMSYDCIVVENVVEATKWLFWPMWRQGLDALGYEVRILSHNSMHHGVPQSRDRIYIVCWRKGLKPDLELELTAWCPRCDLGRPVRQAWKNGRTVGRYRQQYVWACTSCGTHCEPDTHGAVEIIDWSLPCPRIGDRDRPLAPNTRRRVGAGILKHWCVPITTSGAGNVWENTPGMRAKAVDEPLATQQTTATSAVATPPGFLVQTAHGAKDGRFEASRTRDPADPLWTVTGSVDRPSMVMANTTNNVPTTAEDPISTVVAGTQRHALIVRQYGIPGGAAHRHATKVTEPTRTLTASGTPALVVPLRTNGKAEPTTSPAPTVTAGGNHHGLLMRNNGSKGDGAEMTTPVTEPARSLTTKGHQSLLLPYYGNAQAQATDRPTPTVTTRDRCAVIDMEQLVDDCGFRMLEPYEIAAAMAFPVDYIPRDLTKRDQVKLAGNAVTPPVMQWITGRLLQALEAAA